MRWFTDQAYEAGEAEWEAMRTAYQAHVSNIAAMLPPDLAAFASDPRLNLHDAHIRRIAVDREAGTVVLTVALGHEGGLRLTFGDASFIPDNLQAVAYAVGATYTTDRWGTTRTEILAQEIDVTDEGRYLLRLRLWPFGELGLAFSSFSLTERPATADDGRPGEFLFVASESSDD